MASAAVVTVTESITNAVKKIVWEWTSSDPGGIASGATVAPYDGKLLGLATIPGTVGDQPDDNYDITITDDDSHDVLLGAGANRDETNTEYVAEASIAAVAGSVLTLNVAAAGVATKGTVVLWIKA